jgi:hypothetical protein
MSKTHHVNLLPNTLPARFEVFTLLDVGGGEVRKENALSNVSIQYMDDRVTDAEELLAERITIRDMMIAALPPE